MKCPLQRFNHQSDSICETARRQTPWRLCRLAVSQIQGAACLALCLSFTLSTGCNRAQIETASARTGGDYQQGREKIRYYGCASCHDIPGIHGSAGRVGPPLDHIASRSYIGVGLPNTPENMRSWIQHPRDIDTKAAMPNLHIPDSDARDIACYLYTLE